MAKNAEYIAPTDLPQLYTALAKMTGNSKILAGGTDLAIRLRQAPQSPDMLIYLGELGMAKEIMMDGDELVIGAAVTMSQLAACPLLKGNLAAICDSAVNLGSQQIRNLATVGGNIANASPAADMLPVFFLLEATAAIATAAGQLCHRPVQDLLDEAGKCTLAYNEAIIQFRIPAAEPDRRRSAYIKLGYRSKVTVARIGLAMSIGCEQESRIIESARVFLAAVAPRPLPAAASSGLLIGRRPDDALRQSFAATLAELIALNTPAEFDRDYKVLAMRGVVEDIFDRLIP